MAGIVATYTGYDSDHAWYAYGIANSCADPTPDAKIGYNEPQVIVYSKQLDFPTHNYEFVLLDYCTELNNSGGWTCNANLPPTGFMDINVVFPSPFKDPTGNQYPYQSCTDTLSGSGGSQNPGPIFTAW